MKSSGLAILDDAFSYLKRVKTITSRDVSFGSICGGCRRSLVAKCYKNGLFARLKNGLIYCVYQGCRYVGRARTAAFPKGTFNTVRTVITTNIAL